MARSGSSEGLYGLRYLTIVATAAVVVASLALLARSRDAALGAAVLGIYALHLLGVRFLLGNQRRHGESLLAQLELLHRLAARPAPPVDATPERAERPDSAPGTAVPDGSGPAPRQAPLGARFQAPGTAPGVVSVSANGTPGSAGDGPRREDPDGTPVPDGRAARIQGQAEPGEIPIPRHFALGTVALIRQLLTPSEVAQVLMEQRQQPDRRFASLAVEMGLLTDSQREELLLAQQEGLFTEQEMREARERLREFRESTARALSDLD